MTHPTRAHGALTHIARVSLPCGTFDALRAVDFSRRFPPHFHDTFAIGVIESGATRLITPRGQWLGTAGAILALSPGEIHAAWPIDARGWTYRIIYPSAEVLREVGVAPGLLADGEPLFASPVIHDPRLARELLRAHLPMMSGAGAPVEARLARAIRTLAAEYADGDRRATVLRSRDTHVVQTARTYFQAHFTDRVRLGAVADVCGVSRYHFIRVFRRIVGVPPHAYLVQLRVNRAQMMLATGSSVAHVAYACGFSDQSHLTRTFRKVVGIPPGRYLRSVRPAACVVVRNL